MLSEKKAIQMAFSRAANDYDSVAHIQRMAVDLLLSCLSKPNLPILKNTLALDAGCGTGYLTEQLTSRLNLCEKNCFALDMAKEMLRHRRLQKFNTLCGDIENLPLTKHSIDLYASSLAWQWTHAQQALQEAARVLKPGGKLLVATLGENTLFELRESFAQRDDEAHIRTFEPFSHYQKWIEQTGFTHVKLTRTPLKSYWANIYALMRSIKILGAHTLGTSRKKGLTGRTSWQTIQQHYELWRTPQGLPSTYDIIIIEANRQESIN